MIKQELIKVPKGIKHLSDWKEFCLPEFPHVLNKQLTGCGFTQWALTCPMNVILCSPRRMLLENKEDWYFDELEKYGDLPFKVFYARNDFEKVVECDKDISRDPKSAEDQERELASPTIVTPKDYVLQYNQRILDFVADCQNTGKYCKIVVTYDSFRKVKEVLKEIGVYNNFYVVIDEMQSIFVDSKFKSTTELELVGVLQDTTRLCYVSATPMIEDYLNMMDEFKNLPYYELDWKSLDPGRAIKPRINSNPCPRLNQKVLEIIQKYRSGALIPENRYSYVDSSGNIQEIQSKEAVFYINSVKNICDIIKYAKLTPDECNILCANTPVNSEKIRKAFKIKPKDWQGLGKVPREKNIDNNKMFTFCTRTVYLGADFYSRNARSFVFSDANIDCLSIDITLDLPQILGRQRYEKNPWKNELNIFYKSIGDKNKIPRSEFEEYIQRKNLETEKLLRAYRNNLSDTSAMDALTRKYEVGAKLRYYKDDYISVNHHSGLHPEPAFNMLVMISERRSFEIQQIDFADRCTVRNTINNQFEIDSSKVDKIIDEFENLSSFIEKMEFLCKILAVNNVKDLILSQVGDLYSNYYRILGPERIKALSYQKSKLEIEYNRLVNNQFIDLSSKVYREFKVGEKYSKVFIKNKLKELYSSLGYKKSAKASDLENFFKIKTVNYMENGKKTNGFIIESKK